MAEIKDMIFPDPNKPYTNELLDLASKKYPKTNPPRFLRVLLTVCDRYYEHKKEITKREIMKKLHLSKGKVEPCLKLLVGDNAENKRYINVHRPLGNVFSVIDGKILTNETMDTIFEQLIGELENLCKYDEIQNLIGEKLQRLKTHVSSNALVESKNIYNEIVDVLEQNKRRGDLPKFETVSTARRFIPKGEAELVYLENIR